MEFKNTACAAVLPPGFAALMNKVIAKKQSAQPAKPARRGLLSVVEREIALGKEPPLLQFASAVNYTYNRHAEALYKLWQERDAAGLGEYAINGKNTYARALSRYREILANNLKGAA
jgi:hypothetical protein